MSKDSPDILVFPPLVFFGAIVVAVAAQWLIPINFLPTGGTLSMILLGIALVAFALWIAIGGAAAFKNAGTNVNPREETLVIVSDGPYRITRNPMYLGMVLFQFGLALTFSLDWSVIAGVAAWGILHFGVVLREEAYLTKKFGESYLGFLKKRRRWL